MSTSNISQPHAPAREKVGPSNLLLKLQARAADRNEARGLNIDPRDPNTVSVLRSTTQPLTKRWESATQAPVPSADVSLYRYSAATVDSIDSLYVLLRDISADPQAAVIRDALRDEVNAAQPIHRRAHDKPGDPAPFESAPRCWACFDIDGIPDADFESDPFASIELAWETYMPPELQGVSRVDQLSASAGHPTKRGVIKAHCWLRFDRPVGSDELKAIYESIHDRARAEDPTLPENWIDSALAKRVQLHFTANPIVADGVDDPFAGRRIRLVRGECDTTPVPKVDFKPSARTATYAIASDAQAAVPIELLRALPAPSDGTRPGYDALQLALAGKPFAADGDRDNTLLAMSGYLTAQEALLGAAPESIVAPIASALDLGDSEPGWAPQALIDKIDRDRAGQVHALSKVDLQSIAKRAAKSQSTKTVQAAEAMRQILKGDAFEPEALPAVAAIVARKHPRASADSFEALLRKSAQELTGQLSADQIKDAFSAALREAHADLAARALALAGECDETDWHKALITNDEGNAVPCPANVAVIMRRHPGVKLQLNVRTQLPELSAAPPWDPDGEYPRPLRMSGSDATAAGVWLARGFGFLQIGHETIWRSLIDAAEQRPYDPVREMFEALPKWDGADRLDTVFIDAFGADDTRFVRAASRKFFIAIMARTYNPGCKVDNMIVFHGGQGRRKSSFFEALFGSAFYTASLRGDDKDVTLRLSQVVVGEDAELSRLRGKALHEFKAWLTEGTDKIRKPYGRGVESIPRRWVLVGSENSDQFLTDVTGNRRFWPIEVRKSADMAWVHGVRDQLLAEARHRYLRGEQWWLTESEEQLAREVQEDARSVDPWEILLTQKLVAFRKPSDEALSAQGLSAEQFDKSGRLLWITPIQALRLIGSDADAVQNGTRIAGAMRAIGLRKDSRRVIGGIKITPYRLPAELVEAQKPSQAVTTAKVSN